MNNSMLIGLFQRRTRTGASVHLHIQQLGSIVPGNDDKFAGDFVSVSVPIRLDGFKIIGVC